MTNKNVSRQCQITPRGPLTEVHVALGVSQGPRQLQAVRVADPSLSLTYIGYEFPEGGLDRFCPLLYPQHLEGCLLQSWHLINNCCIKK